MKTTIAQHTPGLWYHGRNAGSGFGVWTQSGSFNVLDASAPGINAEANARLIAAAPELLEALKAVVAGLSQPVQSTDLSEADLRRLHGAVLILRGDARFAIETAAAAIAKATA